MRVRVLVIVRVREVYQAAPKTCTMSHRCECECVCDCECERLIRLRQRHALCHTGASTVSYCLHNHYKCWLDAQCSHPGAIPHLACVMLISMEKWSRSSAHLSMNRPYITDSDPPFFANFPAPLAASQRALCKVDHPLVQVDIVPQPQ